MKKPILDVKDARLRKRIGLLWLAIFLLTLIAAGCSSSGDTEPTLAVAEEPTEAMAEEAIETPSPDEEAAEGGDNAVGSDGDGSVSALTPEERNQYYSAPPEMVIDPEKYYFATIATEKGDIKLQLYADRAPKTVNNFVYLANEGFYDDTTFHRVLEGFMAQAGDPTGTGTGGPGYEFEDEIVPGLVFDKPGLLAMANAGPGTNGSQFFVTFAPTEWLNGMHTIFGEVVEGNDVLNEITRRDPMGAEAPGDLVKTIVIEEGGESLIPTPTPLPPTPTPYPPSSMDASDRPLADLDPAERVNYFNTAPEMTIDPEKEYVATITTNKGDMVVELLADQAPMAVNNLVTLANLGFYDGLPVNQIVPDQVVIIGSPDNDPTHDAGYQFETEVGLDVTPSVGSIAYIPIQASPNDPIRSSSSQLLISMIEPPMEANETFGFFGQMTEGEEVIGELTAGDVIESITIEVTE